MKWTDIWQAPFWYDHYGYVWAKDNVMVFTVDDLTEENDKFMNNLACDIADVLNGKESQRKYEGFEIKDGCDLYMNDELIGYFRGWGYLTGASKLKPEEAAKLQDKMIEYVLSKICE